MKAHLPLLIVDFQAIPITIDHHNVILGGKTFVSRNVMDVLKEIEEFNDVLLFDESLRDILIDKSVLAPSLINKEYCRAGKNFKTFYNELRTTIENYWKRRVDKNYGSI